MRNYGKSLKKIRLEFGYSTNELSKGTNISTANISRWETNKVVPNIHFIETLANFYKISIDELIERDI